MEEKLKISSKLELVRHLAMKLNTKKFPRNDLAPTMINVFVTNAGCELSGQSLVGSETAWRFSFENEKSSLMIQRCSCFF